MDEPTTPDAAKLREILAEAPVVVFEWRRAPPGARTPHGAGGTFTFVSDGLARLTGLSTDEVRKASTRLSDLIVPEDRVRIFAAVDESERTGAPIEQAVRIRHVAGELRWVQIKGTPVRDARGELTWRGGMMDVTERVLAAESLRRSETAHRASEERFRALLESAAEAVAVLHGRTGIVLETNECARKLLGDAAASGAGIVAASPDVQPDGRRSDEAFAAFLREVVSSGQVTVFEWTILDRSGEPVPCEVRLSRFPWGDAPLVRASVVDVSARVRTDRAIRSVLQRLAGVTGRAFLKRLVEDLGRTLDVKLAFAGQLVGPTKDRVRTIAAWSEGHRDDFEYGLSGTPCDGALMRTFCVYTERVAEKFPDDAFLAEVGAQSYMASPMHASSGEPTGIVAVIDDRPRVFLESERFLLALYATRAGAELERAHAEDEIRSLNAELETRVAERTAELAATNRELEAFASAVSHDLRVPLRVIDGFVRALLEDEADRLDDVGREYLRRALGATERMARLIDDLLDLSRVTRHGRIERTAVDVSSIAREIAEELRRTWPDREVTFDIEPGLVAVADEGLVRIVLANLIGNAWKFTAKKRCARIDVGATVRDGRRAFFVRDDGAGFDPAQASRLFVPFQRLHSSREFEGTGIGLATVERAVARLGGQVWAEGRVGQGATFSFALEPRAVARAAA